MSATVLKLFGHNLTISRALAIDHGVVEPTPQEAAEMAANSERSRISHAAPIARQTEWFSAILAVAGPIGSAMLKIHVPDRYDECKGCGFEELAGLGWPCATVLAGAEAAGIPEPAGI